MADRIAKRAKYGEVEVGRTSENFADEKVSYRQTARIAGRRFVAFYSIPEKSSDEEIQHTISKLKITLGMQIRNHFLFNRSTLGPQGRLPK